MSLPSEKGDESTEATRSRRFSSASDPSSSSCSDTELSGEPSTPFPPKLLRPKPEHLAQCLHVLIASRSPPGKVHRPSQCTRRSGHPTTWPPPRLDLPRCLCPAVCASLFVPRCLCPAVCCVCCVYLPISWCLCLAGSCRLSNSLSFVVSTHAHQLNIANTSIVQRRRRRGLASRETQTQWLSSSLTECVTEREQRREQKRECE